MTVASFPAETGGSFTNTQKIIQEFDALMKPVVGKSNISQLSCILGEFGLNGYHSANEVFLEFISLFPERRDHSLLQMKPTAGDNNNRIFEYGCDHIVKASGF